MAPTPIESDLQRFPAVTAVAAVTAATTVTAATAGGNGGHGGHDSHCRLNLLDLTCTRTHRAQVVNFTR